MHLRDLKTGARLAIGFGSILLIVVVMVAFTNVQTARNKSGLLEGLVASNAKNLHAATMKSAMLETGVAMRNIGLQSDVDLMQKERQKVQLQNKRYEEARARLQASGLDDHEKRVLADIAAIDKELEVAFKEAISMVLAFNAEGAVKVITGRIDPLSQQTLTHLNKLVEMQQATTNALMERSVRADARLSSMLYLLGAVAVALGVVLAVKLRLGEQKLQRQIFEIQALQAQLNEQALRDPMTGLYNRRYLDTIVPHEIARCGRDVAPLSVMMMDIDHFKHVNDTYGHQGGDEVLKNLAKLLLESVRASDVACRYGGEEFVLVLPNMPLNFALARAQQWRAAFEAAVTPVGESRIRATVSIGIACFPNDGGTPEELIRCADLALYRAKAEGRNRVVVGGVGLPATFT